MGLEPYQLRLLDEYDELKERTDKLEHMLANWGRLDFAPKCPKETLSRQLVAMSEYLLILKERIRLHEGLAEYIESEGR